MRNVIFLLTLAVLMVNIQNSSGSRFQQENERDNSMLGPGLRNFMQTSSKLSRKTRSAENDSSDESAISTPLSPLEQDDSKNLKTNLVTSTENIDVSTSNEMTTIQTISNDETTTLQAPMPDDKLSLTSVDTQDSTASTEGTSITSTDSSIITSVDPSTVTIESTVITTGSTATTDSSIFTVGDPSTATKDSITTTADDLSTATITTTTNTTDSTITAAEISSSTTTDSTIITTGNPNTAITDSTIIITDNPGNTDADDSMIASTTDATITGNELDDESIANTSDSTLAEDTSIGDTDQTYATEMSTNIDADDQLEGRNNGENSDDLFSEDTSIENADQPYVPEIITNSNEDSDDNVSDVDKDTLLNADLNQNGNDEYEETNAETPIDMAIDAGIKDAIEETVEELINPMITSTQNSNDNEMTDVDIADTANPLDEITPEIPDDLDINLDTDNPLDVATPDIPDSDDTIDVDIVDPFDKSTIMGITDSETTTSLSTDAYIDPRNNYSYLVYNDFNVPCTLSSMAITLKIKYVNKDIKTIKKEMKLPKDLKVNGNCGSEKSHMVLSWEDGSLRENSITFEIVKDRSSFYIDNVQVTLSLDPKNFPDAKDEVLTGNSTTDLKLFSAPIKNGVHVCRSQTEVVCGKITVLIKDVSFIAYNDKQDVSKREEEHCSVTNRVSSGAVVGIVVAVVLIIGIIATYVWHRKKPSTFRSELP